jgi:hypothetical protein
LPQAQFHEVGVFLGGSNYVGDVGSHRYLDPNAFAYGVVYKWNVTDRYSLRGGFTLTNLMENEYRNKRSESFLQVLQGGKFITRGYRWNRNQF